MGRNARAIICLCGPCRSQYSLRCCVVPCWFDFVLVYFVRLFVLSLCPQYKVFTLVFRQWPYCTYSSLLPNVEASRRCSPSREAFLKLFCPPPPRHPSPLLHVYRVVSPRGGSLSPRPPFLRCLCALLLFLLLLLLLLLLLMRLLLLLAFLCVGVIVVVAA